MPAVCQLVPTGPATPAASTSRLGISYSELHTSSSQGNEEHKAGQSSSQSTSGTPPSFNMRLTPPAAQDIQSIQKWLRSAFPSFSFPDDIALQLVTHESWDKGLEAGHNRRLGFLGKLDTLFFLAMAKLFLRSASSQIFHDTLPLTARPEFHSSHGRDKQN